MSEHRLSIHGLLCAWLLSSHRLLNTDNPMREALYDEYRNWMARSPDHLFNNAWTHLKFTTSATHPCLLALGNLAQELLVQRHQRWYIKPDTLGAWQQGMASRMSPLPLMAYVAAKHLPVQPYSQRVEDYLSREGLNETHVHLNGSTHAERAWLFALEQPLRSLQDFSKAWPKKPKLRDLVRNVDVGLKPSILLTRLRDARNLRRHLMHAAFDDGCWSNSFSIDTQKPSTFNDWKSFNLEDELRWQTIFLRRCKVHVNHLLWPQVYHRYLLLLNQYYQLIVQNEDRKGFDQFQKHADIGLREKLEENYFQRFKDAHGNNPRRSRVQFYEGRFAPKDRVDKTIRLLANILKGYHTYLSSLFPQSHDLYKQRAPHQLAKLLASLSRINSELLNLAIEPLQLTLVCHFIKDEWTQECKAHAPYRYHSLTKTLHEKCNFLLRVMSLYPGLKQWITGIDGAGNELHAAPEYFAPVFRQCTASGLSRKTFHAGEDFTHLLSGLRYMHESIDLLDLGEGDRLGHGTAMGIDPKLWLARMPQEIIISRGDWFLSVLSAWQLIAADRAGNEVMRHVLAQELSRLSVEIFRQYLDPYLCTQVMACRKLSAKAVMRWIDNGQVQPITQPIDEHQREEMQRVHQAAQNNRQAFDLYWRWQTERELWVHCEQTILVQSEFLNADQYLLLQQSLMRYVAKRGIVIETLPSSNVRISQYKHFTEHHALRWMKVPSVSPEGDPDILVSLGSDDPGIFATDIETEFHHLFFAAKAYGLTEEEALRRTSSVNECGRIYRFHARD